MPLFSPRLSAPDVVLITGASTGLGLALAKSMIPMARRGRYHLVLTARKNSIPRFEKEGIQQEERIWLRELDIQSCEQRRRIVGEITVELGGVDVLVNNAGVSYRSVVEHVTEGERLQQMDVNFLGPMALTRLVLPGMRTKKKGRIINVSSVGGMMAMPTMAVYSASKFALEGATEALWYEVRPWNIHVSLVQPGFIHSDSFKNTRYTEGSYASRKNLNDPYHRHYRSMEPFIAKAMDWARATPERVAQVILSTMRSRSPALRVPATIDAYIFAYLRRFLPRSIYHWMLQKSLPKVSTWGSREPGRAVQTGIERGRQMTGEIRIRN